MAKAAFGRGDVTYLQRRKFFYFYFIVLIYVKPFLLEHLLFENGKWTKNLWRVRKFSNTDGKVFLTREK